MVLLVFVALHLVVDLLGVWLLTCLGFCVCSSQVSVMIHLSVSDFVDSRSKMDGCFGLALSTSAS